MQWAQEAWETVTSTTATNSWRHHTNIIDEDVNELAKSVKQHDLGQQPHHSANKYTRSYSALLTSYTEYPSKTSRWLGVTPCLGHAQSV